MKSNKRGYKMTKNYLTLINDDHLNPDIYNYLI